MYYVILGAGPAGVTAAEAIRQVDKTGSITLVSGDGEPPYSRMALPYFLHGDIAEQGTYLRQQPNHYESLGINVKLASATGIDTRGQTLSLSGGEVLSYDKLLIATGASPVIPRIPGSNLDGVHTCWTLADGREILKRTGKGQHVVLVGAGFIGSIVLEALHLMGSHLTVVEIAPRMVARMLDETAGGMLGRWCTAHGVNVLTSTKVERITGGSGTAGADLYVGLSNGFSVPAKLVVLAAGVRSNTGFLVGSDIAVKTGIVVNDYLETTAPNVYAAGDCCEGVDLSTGKPDMLAIQPVAVEHGRIAGLNMAGVKTRHRGSLNMNVLETMGLISSSFGLWQGVDGGETARLVDEANYKYLKLNFQGDQLVGAQCVGLTENVGMLRGLIQTGVHLGEWKKRLMENPERLREAYVATAMNSAHAGPIGPHVKSPVAKEAA